MKHTPLWSVVATGALIALALSGCTATSTAAATASASAAGPAPAATATPACVTDPAAVVSAKPWPSASVALPTQTAKALDDAVTAALPQAASPGAVVAVRSPQGTWIKAYGVADPATKAAMTSDVYQRIGSVTKTFVGTLVLQLAQRGKLSLNDPVSKYVSGVPNGSRVTVRQLLTMTSGLDSYTRDDTFVDTFMAQPEKAWTPDELVAIGNSLTPIFAPGAKFDYSNTNFVLLGKVVEKVTGENIEKALETGILKPLGLKHTSFPGESAAFPSPHAQGFTLQSPDATPASPTNATDWNPSWGWTAGEMISNASDLLTYTRALATGQGLLSRHEQELRLTSFTAPRTAPSYGMALTCSGGWVGHTGELPGYNTAVYYQTDSATAVVVMANSDIPSGACSVSATLANNPTDIPCGAPAPRLLQAVAGALGYPFTPSPLK